MSEQQGQEPNAADTPTAPPPADQVQVATSEDASAQQALADAVAALGGDVGLLGVPLHGDPRRVVREHLDRPVEDVEDEVRVLDLDAPLAGIDVRHRDRAVTAGRTGRRTRLRSPRRS